jgi:hypothetical protein
MPKKSIALVLLITLTLGPVSGVFGSIMDKINSYRVFVPNTNAFLSKRNPLWFSVKDDNGQQCEEEADYATAVYQEAIPIFGQDQATYALGMFGKIGAFDAELPGYDEFFITNEPSEYYFTDMVFIQQKYEEALVDLYYFRAECSTFEDRTKRSPAPTGSHSRTASATPRSRYRRSSWNSWMHSSGQLLMVLSILLRMLPAIWRKLPMSSFLPSKHTIWIQTWKHLKMLFVSVSNVKKRLILSI